MRLIALLDPAISQAIATISGAIAMLIISYASYKFPRGKDRFDEDDDEPVQRKKKKHLAEPEEAD